MALKIRNTFLYVSLCILFFIFLILYLHNFRHHPRSISFSILAVTAITSSDHHHRQQLLPPTSSSATPLAADNPLLTNISINNSQTNHDENSSSPLIATVSVLLPAWEVLVIVSPDDTPSLSLTEREQYACLYPNNDVSPAEPLGLLTSPDRAAFKCLLPNTSRRKLPFLQPILTDNYPTNPPPQRISPPRELLRWSHIVYDSSVTDDDVVVFAKGFNNRQGLNRNPSEFRCVFYREKDDVAKGVRTVVTSSIQEVFRCKLPQLTVPSPSSAFASGGVVGEDRIKVSLETVRNHVVPTLAYYSPTRKLLSDKNGKKSLLCACTMVYNVAKFLKEWVVYHSSIGIEKFILYDNQSDDNLEKTVTNLNQQGYNVKISHWLWQKTQEAGFSHSVLYAKDSCTWMAYIDVDEFMYSPSWFFSPKPFKSMLQYHISKHNTSKTGLLGQIHVGCYEFGPSNQTVHPETGVTQGYRCRRKYENRHKSIVLMEAIDDSLHNAIHHFSLKSGYLTKKVGIESMAVNHYKFQAWPEFKAKFRRRVSAYVVDWTDQLNPRSNDRTPGLGFSPIEPLDWPQKFCEVYDNGLKDLSRRWFGLQSPAGFKMAWQR